MGRRRGRRRQRRVLRRARRPRGRRSVADAGAGAARGERRQFPLHRRRDPLRLPRHRGSAGDHARPHRGRDRTHRFRHLHDRAVLRRHVPGDALPHRPRALRAPRHALLRDDALAAAEGAALRADLGPPGLQGRRPVQVLGRAYRRSLGRRPGPRRSGDGHRREGRHRDPLRRARRQRSATTGMRSPGCA